ncbi:MAG: DNA alkylation repair protein [Lentisphaerales bacterium]|nr:MAG: DNA alkylation repair protein [Lentisphaerales bacterium]
MSARMEEIKKTLRKMGDPERAGHAQRYFKTGKGEYGEGDRFIGIRVPALRQCAKSYAETPLKDALQLLKSPVHEDRMVALFLMVARFKRGSEQERAAIYRGYLAHTRYINNWDLVDCSAPYIVGEHLFDKSRNQLHKLARSESLWERRISIISTFYFIRHDDFTDALALARTLLHDKEDLMHKAVGWMLRELGKRNRPEEEQFLTMYYNEMPRTMLRYAIEKFPERRRKAYLHGTI